MSEISVLKASLASEEVRYRQAIERVNFAGLRTRQAENRVAEAKNTVWREVARRKMEGAEKLRESTFRDRVAAGPGDALKRLGREMQQREHASHELARDSTVAVSLHRSLADRAAAIKRLERKATVRLENQEHEELAEVATAATLRREQGGLGAVLVQGCQNLGCAPLQFPDPESTQQLRAGATSFAVPGFLSEWGPENGSSLLAADVSEEHTRVRLTLADPTQKVPTVCVEVVAAREGDMVAEVIVGSATLRERVADNKSLIVRKLEEIDLPLASLVISNGGPRAGAPRQRVGRRIQRRQEGNEDEVCVA